WITRDQLMGDSAGSPIDADQARDLARDAGIQLVERESDPWEDLHRLATEGTRDLPAPAEEPTAEALHEEEEEEDEEPAVPADFEVDISDPTSIYLREISRTPLLTADQEVQLAKEMEAGKGAKRQLEEGIESHDRR